MKIKRKTVVSLIAASLACSCGMTAGAGTVNRDMLIRGLLMREDNSNQYRIMEYNTNDDGKVNVLDLCRVIKDSLYGDNYNRQYIRIEPAVPSDTGQMMENLIVPVRIQGNYNGISAVSFNIEYDKKHFIIRDAYASDGGSLTFSKRTGSAQYTASDGRYSREGEFIYFIFSPASEVPASVYNFKLNNIRCVVQENNGVPRTLSSEECPVSTECSFNFMWPVNMPVATTAVTEPPVTEPPVTDPPVTTTVTTVNTTESTTSITTGSEVNFEIEDLEREIAELVNKDREQHGMSRLSLNQGLCRAADKRAEELAVDWALSRPGGATLSALFKECGVTVRAQSQVFVARSTNSSEIMTAINNTKVSTFDNPDFNSIGVGHAFIPGSEYGHYWVVFVART